MGRFDRALAILASTFSAVRCGPIGTHQLVSLLRWVLVCWVIVFWRLGYLTLLDPDPAHYSQITLEMLQARSWLVPLLDGAPFIDKPILFHWLQALSFRLIGETEFAARLPSALAALALFATTRWVGIRLWGEAVGERSWLMLATIPATFALARLSYLDMVFTAFLFGGIACLFVATLRGRPNLQYIGYALLSLAIMTKGPVALLLVCLLFSLAWATGGESRTAMRSLHWKSGLVGAMLGSSPWFIWMYWQFGDQFVREYVLAGNVSYLTQTRLSASSTNHTFYLLMFLATFFPWSVVTTGYAIDTLWRWRNGRGPSVEERLLWAWIVVIIAFFTLARFRIDRYIFPAAPASCLLAAKAWVSAKNGAGVNEYPVTRVSVFLLALSFAAIGILLTVNLPVLGLRIPRAVALLPLALTIGGVALVVLMIRRRLAPPPVLAVPLCMMIVAYGMIVAAGFPVLEQVRPTRQLAHWLRVESEPCNVALYRLERWRASLRYYARCPLQRLNDEDEVRGFLAASRRGRIVMLREEYDALSRVGIDGRVAFVVPAVTRTSGWGIRRQIWSDVVIVTAVD